ncbi:MAG: GGDEF domain-containing protein [Halochromatium sp.]|nr:GGDEF domain-containing protein [Halochromatium sp.]
MPYSILNKKTAQFLRFRYLAGLIAIALLVTASYVTMQRVVSEQRNFAQVVNLAGHQSGLVNRVAYFATQMATAYDDEEFDRARAQVGRTINRIEENHALLREGSLEAGIPRITSPTLNMIYDDPMVGLDHAIKRFLDRARIVYETNAKEFSTNSNAYIFLNVYGPHALEPLLDAAVDEYQRIGRDSIVRIERLELGIWIAALVMLLIEVFVIFRPLEKRVKESIASLEETVTQLEETRSRLLSAQTLAKVGDWQWNPRTERLTCSEQAYQILGVDPLAFEPTLESLARLVRAEDRGLWRLQLQHSIEETHSSERALEYRILRPDSEERVIHQQVFARHDSDGHLLSLAGTMQDMTERLELSTRLQKLSQHIPGFIYQFELRPDGTSRLPFASQGIIGLYGIWPEQVREDASLIFASIHPADVDRFSNAIFASASDLHVWTDQYRVQHPSRGEIWLECHATPERLTDGGTLWYGYVWEITDRKRSEDQIRQLALYDPLTGLANRRLLRDRMEHALLFAQRTDILGAVLMLDLDNFKALNDTEGHDVGDALLVEVGRRMTKQVRASDTIARLGGDEFVIVLEGLAGSRAEAQQQALRIANTIQQAINQPYALMDEAHSYQTSVSIGVCFFDDTSTSVDHLLRQADIGMFEAKEAGRNRICLFSEKRQSEIHTRTSLLQELRSALQQDQFSLHYQPQFQANGELKGAEALLRWHNPSRGMVSPAEFIPLAEETGLILSIGEWVLDTACRDLRQIQESQLHDDFSISVNISPRQFADADFLSKVKRTLSQAAVSSRRLRLELTEGILFQDVNHAIEVLEDLRAIGIGIELDDFGTGYSSLSYLKRLPLDALKLDGSLVRDVTGDTRDLAILRAAIAMAKTLSLTVIAEGVETQEQRAFLAREGCDLLQGFLLARPMPFIELYALLERSYPSRCQEPINQQQQSSRKSQADLSVVSTSNV